MRNQIADPEGLRIPGESCCVLFQKQDAYSIVVESYGSQHLCHLGREGGEAKGALALRGQVHGGAQDE